MNRNIKSRIDRLEKRAPTPTGASYQAFKSQTDYQRALAAGEVKAAKVYIGFNPDDWGRS